MHKIAIAGAGTIGSALLRLIVREQSLRDENGKPLIEVRSVLVRDLKKPRPGLPSGLRLVGNPEEILSDPEIETVVELMGGTDDAFIVAARALKEGKNVVTANKNLLAERGPEIFAMAREAGKSIGFEAAVCAGIPIIRAFKQALRLDKLSSVEGILNGTTNYILTRMTEEGLDYPSALREAQRLGFAEPDPRNDVSGTDSACKLGILASLAFGSYLDYRGLPVEGIEGLDAEDLRQAKRMGYVLKLVASARRGDDGAVDAGVGPVLLPAGHPLASVRNEYNAVLANGNDLGLNLFMGKGAGPSPTAISLLTDIVDIAQGKSTPVDSADAFLSRTAKSASGGDSVARYYLRLSVPDRPGVLAQVSSLFAKQEISIASVLQPETAQAAERVPLILTTHPARGSGIASLLAALGTEHWGKPVLLRIIED